MAFAALFLAYADRSFAETVLPPVVVTATKQETSIESVAASVTVIPRDEIEKQRAASVPEVLRNIAGADVISAGSAGDDVDVRLRGADRDEVLVLIDGVSVNNITEHRASFLGTIPLDNVERIEVVRGSQGVLYGSDAVGGVINIITRRGGEGHDVGVWFEGGNLQTFREGVDANGGVGKFRYSGSFSRTDRGGRFNRDRFGEWVVSGNFGVDILPELKLDFGAQYLRDEQNLFYEFQTAFDPATLSLLVQIDPDADNHIRRDTVVSHVSLKAIPLSRWSLELLYGLLVDREHLRNSDVNDTAPPGFAPNVQDFRGKGLQNTVDLRNFFTVYDSEAFSTQLTVGFEFQDERLSFTDPPTVFPDAGQKGARQNYAPYFQQNFRLLDGALIFTGGARYDHNTTFGNEWSPAGSVLYRLKKTGTTFRGSYGEGFHGPTIQEFFDQVLLRATGDPSFQPVRLQSERSQSYEVSIDQKIGKWAKASATFFYIDYDRLFDGLEFTSDAFSTGVEAGVTVEPLEWLSLGGNYTFLKAVDEDRSRPLVDRPRHHGNFFVQARPVERLSVRADVNVAGSRRIPDRISTSAGDLGLVFTDTAGNTSAGRNLPGYVKVDLAASYDVVRNWRALEKGKIYFKIENLLDDSYQEKFGFPAPGITFLGGMRAEF